MIPDRGFQPIACRPSQKSVPSVTAPRNEEHYFRLESLQVAPRKELDEARQLTQALSAAFPGQYEVRNSEGKVVLIME
jgi:hypothetical protein